MDPRIIFGPPSERTCGCEGRAGRTTWPGRGENCDLKQLLLRRQRLSHRAVIYAPTGLVVMALRNASGDAMVEMVCVPSPTP